MATRPLAIAGVRPVPSVVADALREAIADGRLRAGERIKEIPLAEQLGVSRGPIRDALRLLEQEGLVELLPNRGARIPTVHAADALEVYALRAAIGSLALQKLLHSAPVGLGPLETELKRLERAVAAGNEAQAGRVDLAYQEAIVRLAGLAHATREFARLSYQVRMFFSSLDARSEQHLPDLLEEVRALHQALVDRDPRRAERLWRTKCERWVRHVVAHVPGEDFDAELWLTLTAGPR
jgi:DNA-binding GntR family transcriptional regulator